MGPLYISSMCAIFLMCLAASDQYFCSSKAAEIPFDREYIRLWGGDHVSVYEQGRLVQIKIDPTSGGGFRSKYAYGSGFFRMSLKVPRNSNGIATTFYLTSAPDRTVRGGSYNHDELDFEIILNKKGSFVLNTNVFAQDSGNREQQFNLWFDPTSAFHDYEILWNQHQIVFFIDRVPIRVYKNQKGAARFPSQPMYVHASLWNGTQWLGPVNWRLGPFYADYRTFEINGCPFSRSDPRKCESLSYSWNAQKNWQLDPQQERIYQNFKNRHLIYDYCKAEKAANFPECRFPS